MYKIKNFIDRILINIDACLYCANIESYIYIQIYQHYNKGSFASPCYDEDHLIGEIVLTPKGDEYRKLYIAQTFAQRTCYSWKLFPFYRSPDSIPSSIHGFIKITHECALKTVTETIHLPEINIKEHMIRKLDITLGFMNLTTQNVNKIYQID